MFKWARNQGAGAEGKVVIRVSTRGTRELPPRRLIGSAVIERGVIKWSVSVTSVPSRRDGSLPVIQENFIEGA